MKNSAYHGGQFIVTLPVLISLSLFISCVSNNTSNRNANKDNNTAQIAEAPPVNASDDAEELAKIIKLPLTPQEVYWVEMNAAKVPANAAGTDSKKLTAVLKLSDADSAALTAQVEKIAPPQNVAIEPEEWFPAELIAQSETAGDQSLKGRQYDARDFLQPPYIKGRLIKLEQAGYFVLELTTF